VSVYKMRKFFNPNEYSINWDQVDLDLSEGYWKLVTNQRNEITNFVHNLQHYNNHAVKEHTQINDHSCLIRLRKDVISSSPELYLLNDKLQVVYANTAKKTNTHVVPKNIHCADYSIDFTKASKYVHKKKGFTLLLMPDNEETLRLCSDIRKACPTIKLDILHYDAELDDRRLGLRIFNEDLINNRVLKDVRRMLSNCNDITKESIEFKEKKAALAISDEFDNQRFNGNGRQDYREYNSDASRIRLSDYNINWDIVRVHKDEEFMLYKMYIPASQEVSRLIDDINFNHKDLPKPSFRVFESLNGENNKSEVTLSFGAFELAQNRSLQEISEFVKSRLGLTQPKPKSSLTL
jgi:Asp-tRNA(Asn)/Glu-tRNA(Gln) amidotransferase C subunit